MPETLDEWNNDFLAPSGSPVEEGDGRSCACCTMPVCPEPEFECETRTGEVAKSAIPPFSDPGLSTGDAFVTLYSTVTQIKDNEEDIISETYQFRERTQATVGSTTFYSSNFWESTAYFTTLASPTSSSYIDGFTEPGDSDCTTFPDAGELPPDYPPLIPSGPDDDTYNCTATQKTWVITHQLYETGSPLTADTCPGPFGSGIAEYADLERKFVSEWELTDSYTRASIYAEAQTDAAAESWTSTTTGLCAARVTLNWPVRSSETWPTCENRATDAGGLLTQVTDWTGGQGAGVLLTQMRYRWIVPASHDGSYFKIEWDEVYYPPGWDEPGGDAPVVTPKSWEWSGGDKTSPWSSTVEPPVPTQDGDGTPLVGETRLRNVRYFCYPDSPFGYLPQIHPDFDAYVP